MSYKSNLKQRKISLIFRDFCIIVVPHFVTAKARLPTLGVYFPAVEFKLERIVQIAEYSTGQRRHHLRYKTEAYAVFH